MITVVLLGCTVVRKISAFGPYLMVTSVLIAIGTASIFLIEVARQIVRLRLPVWISAALALRGAGAPAKLRRGRPRSSRSGKGGNYELVDYPTSGAS